MIQAFKKIIGKEAVGLYRWKGS